MQDKSYGYFDFQNENKALRNPGFPLIINILITDSCNLRCRFCCIDSEKYECNKFIDKKLCFKIIEEASTNGIMAMSYSGGEPLLYNRQDLLEILSFGKDKGISQTITTNGLLLDDKTILELSKYINSISISIHGNRETHNYLTQSDCYDEVIKNIENIKKLTNLDVNILYTITKENADKENITSVAELAKTLGADLMLARGNAIGKCKKNSNQPMSSHINIVADIMRELNEQGYNMKFSNCVPYCVLSEKNKYLAKACSAGTGYCAIDSNGKVKICAESQHHIGIIDSKTSISDIWGNMEMVSFRSLDWMSQMCKSCKQFYMCKGGCKVESDRIYGIDNLLSEKIESIWSKMCNKKLKLRARILKEYDNKMWLYSKPAIVTSLIYKDILLMLANGQATVDDIMLKGEESSLTNEEVKLFLVDMYDKGIIL